MHDAEENAVYEDLLNSTNYPDDVRALPAEALPQLAGEIREFLIESVSKTGGHLAAGLGVIELTVALHYVFNTPHDRLIWDVGHQAYPHKILTGRREGMSSLRMKDGLSGFPRREESEFDTFGVGHSSTSISAALGMAVAAEKQGIEREIVAIIGDGALSAGMAFEALNHAGSLDTDLLVILNDNDMSISSPVGAVSKYLTKILSSRTYNKVRDGSRSAFKSLPGVVGLMERWEEHMKGMVIPGTLFEELGFNYMGPIDGHDIKGLIATLENLKQIKGPRFLHVVTQKGKGYHPAEGNPSFYHGVTPFDLETGEPLANTSSNKGGKKGGKSFTKVFGQWICDAAENDDSVIAITPAMCEGSGLVQYSQQFPERYYDVAIAEQHAVTLAAGMACDGLKPVVAIYSTFLQRAYDQLIHDVALQNLDVTFAVDRAGMVGADGATHAGSFDLTYARCIPNMVVMVPSNEKETRLMLQTALEHPGPAMVRYPRGTGPGVEEEQGLSTIEIGKAETVRAGKSIAILAYGELLANALEVGEKLDATVVNMRFVKPLDEDLIRSVYADHDILVTLENNAVQGGAGSAIAEFIQTLPVMQTGAKTNGPIRILHLGIPDEFIEHATQHEQLTQAGLDVDSIIRRITELN